MKQRLLLSLLMLFVSVGILKAAIRITVPEGSGTVTVTLASATYNQFSLENYPWMYLSNNSKLATVKASGSTVTYTYTPAEGSKGETLIIYTSNTSNITYKEEWKDLSIAVTGKVTNFITDGGDFLNQFVGIDLHDTGLSELQLGDNQRYTNYFPNLKTLNVANNKLTYIPLKINGKTTIEHYTVGKQTPDISFKGMRGNAKDGIKLTVDALNFGSDNPLQGEITDLQIATLYKDGAAVNYAVADPNYASTKKYTFKDGDIYVDGSFTADIQVNDEKYKGAIICGVPVTVEAALFKVLKAEGDAFGTINIGQIKVGDELKKGQTITVTPEPKDGYKLNGEPKTEGLTKTRNDNDVYYYTVTGDEDIEITASFVADGTTLKYTAPANATIQVKNADGTEVSNGASVTVGEKLTVIIKPNEGYTVKENSVKDGETVLKNISKDAGIFEAEVTVDADGVNITAEVAVVKSTLTIVYEGDLESATVKNNTTGDNITPKAGTTYEGIAYKTPLTITLKLKNEADRVSSVTIESKPCEPRKTADKTYVIENYSMPANDVRVVVKIASITDITITPTMEKDKDDNSKYYVTYDGMPNPVTYTVTPNNMQGVKVQYARDEQGAQPQDNAYTDCGDYVAYFSYEADKTHQIASGSEKVVYKIVPAQVVITEVPTVTIDEDNKFVIKGGKAAYMRDGQPIDITDVGKFVLADGYTTYDEGEKDVKVNFVPNDAKNLVQANATVILELEGVKKYTVKIDPSSEDILTMWNGNAQIESGATVLEGTTIEFKIEQDVNLEDDDYNVVQLDGGNNVVKEQLKHGVTVGNSSHVDTDANILIFAVKVTDTRSEWTLDDSCDAENERIQEWTYDGSVKKYDPTKLILIDSEGTQLTNDNTMYWTITYTLNGQIVAEPTDAGTYTVSLTRNAGKYSQAFSTTATLIINKAKLDEAGITVPTPTTNRINVGLPLYYSTPTGSADIAGHYWWGVNVNQEVTDSNKTFPVVFYPDNENYEPLTLKEMVTVPLTNEAIIMIYGDGNGSLTITDSDGKTYDNGDAVKEGTILTFMTTPYDNTEFEFEALIIDGVFSDNGATYTFGKKSIEVSYTFKPKSTEVIDPNSQYKVTVTESVRGTIISHPGENIVKKGSSFSFTVSTLSADANKVSVTASNGTVTKGSNGRYTVSNIQANTTVRVSLSNPTPLKVEVQKSYLNDKKYHVGSVEIAEGESTTYYYGDVITVVAYPESGVKFEKWSDGSKEQVHEIELKGDMKVTATFSGIPTGIEDIESAAITTGKGFIMVKNVANAKVTVISISGRLQAQEEVSGDTRIDVPQGIYVVVLESGSDVKRAKVIVK